MAMTLAQAKNLSQNKLTQYVIDEFRKSALLDHMVFDNNAKQQGGRSFTYAYNRMKTQAQAAGRAIGTEYTPQEADTERVSIDLKILGGAFQIDRALQANEQQVVDLAMFQLEQKLKATRALAHDWIINGDSEADATSFDGIDKIVSGTSTEYIPEGVIDLSTSAAIDANWKVLLDAMRKHRSTLDGAPTLYLMNAEMFGAFQSVMDRAGIHLLGKENYGDEALQWGGSLVMSLGDKQGTAEPIIPVDEVDGTTGIYALRIALDGVHMVSPEAGELVKQYLPDMAAPGAVKTGEVEMIAGLAVKSTRAAGIIRGIQVAA